MTNIEIAADSPLVEDQAVQLRRAIVASTIGTMIEWYDFYIYGIVTGLVFGKLFFPESEPLTGHSRPSASMRSASLRGRSGRQFSVITATASAANRR